MTDESALTTWAEEVEAASKLPPRQEFISGDIKTVIDYKFGEEDERIKITSQYKIQTKRVPRNVAKRKRWNKFGQSESDPPGPNPTLTYLGEEFRMQFVRNREGEQLDTKQDLDDPLAKLKASGARMACRYCKGTDHYSPQCPYKELVESVQNIDVTDAAGSVDSRKKEADDKMRAGTYVAPAMRSNAAAARAAVDLSRKDDFTVRVTNLPEDTTDDDLKELFKLAGSCRIARIFLAKDKVSNRSKGFAFVTYYTKEDAERAIMTISGHRYEHLILKVEWARPNVNS